MFVSVLSVHAITMKTPSRSAGPAYSRASQVIEPSAASASSSGPASGEIDGHVAAAGEQALGLLQAHRAAADDEAAATLQLQARDVERRVQHVLHAGLVADPA